MTSTVQDLVGLPLTIRVDWDKEWKAAICEELEVSGFGETLDDALAAVARSIRSAIACKANASITGGGTPYRGCTGSALALAKQFHDIYERLAPSFGYETRPETRDFDPDSANGRLMVAVCQEIIEQNAEHEPRALASRDPCSCSQGGSYGNC